MVRRLAAAIAMAIAAVTLTLFLLHLAGGSPWGQRDVQSVAPEVCARLRAQFGLDRPIWEQYGRYLWAVLHGDLGQSFWQRRPVIAALGDAMPNTLLLAGTALLIDFTLGLALGVYQAARARRFGDIALGNAALFVNSMPTFWLGLVLLLVFGQWLHLVPAGGTHDPVLCARLDSLHCVGDRLWHLALPALTLGLVGAAATGPYQRALMLVGNAQDVVLFARAQGLRGRRVLLVHALRNALLPSITLFGLAFPFLLTRAPVGDWVIAWPGMGWLAVIAIRQRDSPEVHPA